MMVLMKAYHSPSILLCLCPAPSNLNDNVVSVGTEDDDDVEYNYLADQVEEEKEEFRDDRAVRISSELCARSFR
jgi:hypothetical protein